MNVHLRECCRGAPLEAPEVYQRGLRYVNVNMGIALDTDMDIWAVYRSLER